MKTRDPNDPVELYLREATSVQPLSAVEEAELFRRLGAIDNWQGDTENAARQWGSQVTRSRGALCIVLATAIAVLCVAQVSDQLSARIPKPDQSKYKGITDAKNWQNPYLIVSAMGVEVRIASERREVAVRDVIPLLASLPGSAWPYGLVVAVQDIGVQAPGDAPRVNKNRDRLLQELGRAHVAIEPWPSN